ncbi:MAG TPA: DUF3198 domain-containing protein [Thermoplasmata archaeon]|nr:DUF3198 domain-containing protein [Thermoplasmata archaeon]
MSLLRDLRYELSTLVFGLGILSMILSFTYWVIPAQTPDWLRNINDGIGNWMIWVAFLGFLALLGGGYYFIDTIRKEREFDHLVTTTSKEIFVKNQGRIEELAYYHLPSSYEKRYQQKRKEFRIKG